VIIQQIHIPEIALSNALVGTRDKACRRNDMSEFYADMLRAGCKEWGEVNAAIIGRWSVSGLVYIKKRAWGLVKGDTK